MAPVPFETVLRAKNLAALAAIVLMTLFTTLFGYVLHAPITPTSAITSIFLTLILALFLSACGNLTSVILPRAIDPSEAFRNPKSGKATLWLMPCFVAMAIRVGLAFLARWAFDSEWAFLLVLCRDLILGLIVSKLATETRGCARRTRARRFLDVLSKGKELVGNNPTGGAKLRRSRYATYRRSEYRKSNIARKNGEAIRAAIA